MRQIQPYVIRQIIQATMFIAGAILVYFGILDQGQADKLVAELAPILLMLASGFAYVHIDKDSDTPVDAVAERAAEKAIARTVEENTPDAVIDYYGTTEVAGGIADHYKD